MSFYLGIWLVGFVFSLFRGIWTDLAGAGFLTVDLVAVLTVYLFTQFGGRAAGLFALGQGFFLDVFSVGPGGLHVALYLFVLLGTTVGGRFFNMQEAKGQLTVVFLAVLFEKAAFFALVPLFGEAAYVPLWPWAALSSAMISGLASPIVFHVLNTSKAAVVGEE